MRFFDWLGCIAVIKISVLFTSILTIHSNTCQSAEGGRSNYVPGYYGDYAVAVAPQPGIYVYSTAYSYQGNFAAPGGESKISLEGIANLSGFQYVLPQKFHGLTFAFASYTSFINAKVEIDLATPLGPLQILDEDSGHGDTSVSPFVVYGSLGNFHWSFYNSIFLPTGSYSRFDAANISRNYYSLDSVLSLTWLDPKMGIELSVVPGIMANLENPSTDYRTGTEFHVDVMANLYLSKTFAFGAHGYFYDQIEKDSGTGSIGAALDGRSAAIGPSFLWVPQKYGVEGKIVGKWLHEFYAKERFEGDIVSITGAIKF